MESILNKINWWKLFSANYASCCEFTHKSCERKFLLLMFLSLNACFARCVVRVLFKNKENLMALFQKYVTSANVRITIIFQISTNLLNDVQLFCVEKWRRSNKLCAFLFLLQKKNFEFPENGIKMMDGARAKIPDVKCHKSSSTIDFIVLISISHINYFSLSSSNHRFWNCDHVEWIYMSDHQSIARLYLFLNIFFDILLIHLRLFSFLVWQ